MVRNLTSPRTDNAVANQFVIATKKAHSFSRTRVLSQRWTIKVRSHFRSGGPTPTQQESIYISS